MTNLQQRILSAAILAPLVLGVIWAGGLAYLLFLGILFLLAAYEWASLLWGKRPFTAASLGWGMFGALYLAAGAWAFWAVRRAIPHGLENTFLVFVSVWATDSFAYFIGIKVGGPKLAPRISPSKTWAGLLGGMMGAGLTCLLFSLINHYDNNVFYFLGGACLAIVAQAGDLLESALKRFCGAKDSGKAIPGHGGVLDRIDGLLAAMLGFACLQEGLELSHIL